MKNGSIIVAVSSLVAVAGCGSSNNGPSPHDGGMDGTADAGHPVEAGQPDAPPADAGVEAAAPMVQRLRTAANKVDLVLVVDNSPGMAVKQYFLSQAATGIVQRFVNPLCLDNTSGQPITSGQPTDPSAACPMGSTREFPPVTDMHVGLLSSSLGTFGADGCPERPPPQCTGATPNSISNDDHGHLVTRTDPCGTTDVPTYQSQGFLAWDPAQVLNPPGIQQASDLATGISNLVVGDGQLGCGFESQNEAWYRFLVDPTPYQSISLVNDEVQVSGTDTALLTQRKTFLRPDSLLAVVVLSDETDDSIKEYSEYPVFAAPELFLPHPSSACATSPTDPCCYSCGQAAPTGCTADPLCTSSPSYTSADEDVAIRAFGLISHKARFGIEFLYQPSRYITALTQPTVTDVNGATVPNPIFTNLDPTNHPGALRDPSMVYYDAIVGVPWQLVARANASGVPDLINGVSALDSTQIGGFKSGKELALVDGHGNTFWDDIAGDPENYVLPKSPFMQESTVPRNGTDPITNAAISPTTTQDGQGSQVGGALLNDHEYTIVNPPGDIEYACVFNLPAPVDCTMPGVVCDCPSSAGTTTDNPVCDPTTPTMEVKGKAYPGIKHLAIARGMGVQGVVGSICPKQVTDTATADYGYQPAVQSLVEGVRGSLRPQCLASALTPGANQEVACTLIEATQTPAGACTCDSTKARAPVTAADQAIVTAAKADPAYAAAGWNCFCEVDQLAGAALTDCQTDAASTSNGWCYVAASMGTSQAAVTSQCPAATPQEIRLVGTGAPSAGGAMFLGCQP